MSLAHDQFEARIKSKVDELTGDYQLYLEHESKESYRRGFKDAQANLSPSIPLESFAQSLESSSDEE